MSHYDDDYFFIRPEEGNDRLPYLKPDTNTNERSFRYQAEAMGSAPLIFNNGLKEDFQEVGKKEVITDILFGAGSFIARSHVREKLLPFDIRKLHLHPAVYIDDSGNWHEDYWYFTFSDMFDCWDRTNSTFRSKPINLPGRTVFDVYTYSLDDAVLDKTPLGDRLLFKMGGTMSGLTVCHKSLAGIFRAGGNSGARLVPITED